MQTVVLPFFVVASQMEIVEVLVLGVLTAKGLQPGEPGIHFSLFKVDEPAV
jgi:hypothetical protein